MQNNSSVTNFQQLQERWTTLLNRLHDDPKVTQNVTQVMETRLGQYLSSHPVLALTVMVFGVMAALPVGLFLVFALVTIIMSAVGFIFFEVFLLFVGGLTLLCVLSGLAFFAVMVSVIFNVFYITIFNILNYYDSRLTKQHKVQGKENNCESSKLKEMQ
ncbi:promethin isoform X1 [Seriola dumerili]|uniref:promethin isoform X1 n=1 Tax=Seriola dumerili TaxID=41447 RepID=UPI000BBEAC1E|nr:promethin isoform X1 [Seriola dumerili]